MQIYDEVTLVWTLGGFLGFFVGVSFYLLIKLSGNYLDVSKNSKIILPEEKK